MRSFSTHNQRNSLGIEEIKKKLHQEKSVKVYESKYSFNSEKLLINSSLVFLIVSSSTIFLTASPLWFKAINAFLFVPSLLVQLELWLGKTKFVKAITLTDKNSLIILPLQGKSDNLKIKSLMPAEEDTRVIQKDSLNHETFFVFTTQENRTIYHVPREGIYLNEELFHNIFRGKTLDEV